MGRRTDGADGSRPRFRLRSFLLLFLLVAIVVAGIGYGSLALAQELGPKTGAWERLDPTGTLPPVSSNGMTYAPEAGKVIVYYSAESGVHRQTWAYDLARNTFEDLETPGAGPRDAPFGPMAYDESTGQVVRLGIVQTDDQELTWACDTWSYNLETNKWTDLRPSVSPPPLNEPAMAYEPTLRKVVLFGGSGHVGGVQFQDDTWAYDSTTNSWAELKPAHAPTGRASAAMAYDEKCGGLVLFGGMQLPDDHTQPDLKALNDTWAYDAKANEWTNLRPDGAPPARWGAAMAYDRTSGKIILFGGTRPQGGVLDDTWVYDSGANAWTKLDPADAPPGRTNAFMFCDRLSGRAMLCGGLAPYAVLGDVWTFLP
jgi:hypothetical protein